ncbi:MAG: hypothetical protein AAFO06_16680 [Cyanobacteria bacterium J06597_16]
MVLFQSQEIGRSKSQLTIPVGTAICTLGLAVGVAAPAQADTGLVPYAHEAASYAPLQTEQSQAEAAPSAFEQAHTVRLQRSVAEQARLEKLHRLRAGISPERRLPQSQIAQPQRQMPAPTEVNRLADGVYLYGQQPRANQLATAYFVFETQNDQVTGAFYMPSSSYDCVQGRIGADQMALTVTDSYSQDVSQYALGLSQPAVEVASRDGYVATPSAISGFYQLPVSESDRALLATCQARY